MTTRFPSTTAGVLLAAALVGGFAARPLARQAQGAPAATQPGAPAAASAGRSNILDGTLGDPDAGPELSTAELRALLKDPNVVVLDARPQAEFAVSHLPGARSVPGKPGTSGALYTPDATEILKTLPDRARTLVLYCNGMYCGRSRRFAVDLLKAGYKTVRRYQLGIQTWRALGGITQVEKDALLSLLKSDGTAALIDAREASEARPPLPNAKNVPLRESSKAKDDGRLPMTDHNTRVFVVGQTGAQARAVAEAIARDAFHNVSFFDGSISELRELQGTTAAGGRNVTLPK